MTSFQRRTFRADELVDLGQPPPDVAPLLVGDWCTMNSGSPPLLVVEAEAETVVVAYKKPSGDIEEYSFPRECVRRTVAGVGTCLECQSPSVGSLYCKRHEAA